MSQLIQPAPFSFLDPTPRRQLMATRVLLSVVCCVWVVIYVREGVVMSQTKGEPKTQKFLVTSIDTDQEQTFFDVVFAKDQDASIKRIARIRPYATNFDSMSMDELDLMVNRIKQMTRKDVAKDLKEIEDSLG